MSPSLVDVPARSLLSLLLVVALCDCRGRLPSDEDGSDGGVVDVDGGVVDPNVAVELARFERLLTASCRAAFRPETCLPDATNVRRFRAAIRRGALTLDPALLEECMQAPAVTNEVGFGFEADDPCMRLWRGHTEDGAACDIGFDCQSDAFCERDDYSRETLGQVPRGCGICRARRPEGESCSGHDFIGGDIECQSGLVCSAGVCARPGALGEACASGRCADGYCNGATCVASGQTPAGGSCDRDEECSPRRCLLGVCRDLGQAGETCLGFPWECAPALTCDAGVPGGEEHLCRPAHEGDLCWPGDIGGVDCADGSACILDGTLPEGSYPYRCVPVVELRLGEHGCFSGPTCAVGHVCRCVSGTACSVNDRCVVLSDEGGVCTADDECRYGTECVAGVCRELGVVGASCARTCFSGTCESGVCVTPPEGSTCSTADSILDPCGALLCTTGATETATCTSQPGVSDPCSVDGVRCQRGSACSNGACEAACVLEE